MANLEVAGGSLNDGIWGKVARVTGLADRIALQGSSDKSDSDKSIDWINVTIRSLNKIWCQSAVTRPSRCLVS